MSIGTGAPQSGPCDLASLPALSARLEVSVPLAYSRRRPKAVLKRAFDVSAAAAGLVALSPVMAVVAVAIKLSSPGPVFFAQERVGAGGRLFKLYKFRTMVPNAEALKDSLAALNEANGPVFKIRRDPRITPIGRFLRKHSLDELPQLLSILLGDMSVVGPRPPVPEEVRKYEPHQLRRLSVPQGLTCIWQISGRSNVSFEDWVRMDLKYIDSWSLRQDLKIILKTFRVVIEGSGAY